MDANNSLLTNFTDEIHPGIVWTFNMNLTAPAIAFIVLLHLLLALPANLFVVLYSLSHCQDFKKGATILLFCLAVSNLIMVTFYMPFVIVATSADEWIFGNTDHIRQVLCHMHGFVYELSITVTNHVIVVISIERFFYIVKVHLHSKIMSWKVITVIMAAVWVLSILWCLCPYYGLGDYRWSTTTGGCLAFFLHDSRPLTVVFMVYSVLLLIIILVTTLWTLLFTRGFLKKLMKRNVDTKFSDQAQSDYNCRVRSLVGIFGALLIVNIFSWISYVFAPVFYALIGHKNVSLVPVEVDVVLFIFSLTNTVANPIIQIYFRRDMHSVLKKFLCFWRNIKNHNITQRSKSKENGCVELQNQIKITTSCSITSQSCDILPSTINGHNDHC